MAAKTGSGNSKSGGDDKSRIAGKGSDQRPTSGKGSLTTGSPAGAGGTSKR